MESMIDPLELLELLIPVWGGVDWVTDSFIFLIVSYAIGAWIYFVFKKIQPQKFLIHSLTEDVSEYTRPAQPSVKEKLREKFTCNDKLAEIWQEFEDSLITNQNQTVIYKTDEASFFFSEDRLLEQHLNLRLWNSVPALLVGIGILGTFVGLVWGLIPFSDIDFTQTGQIRDAIRELLSGVSTAFVTSVWGMLTSLVFNFVEKLGIGGVRKSIADLQHALDRLFTLTTQEEITFRQEKELVQQTAALKAFSTDLANDIKSAMDSIISDARDRDMEDSRRVIQELHNVPDAISKALEPSFSRLNVTVENLSTAVVESQNDIQGELEGGKAEIFHEMHKLSLPLTQIETLAETIGRISKNLIDLSEYVPQIANDIQEMLKLSVNQTDKQFDQRLMDIGESFQQSIQTLQDIQQGTHTLLQLQGEQIEAINNQLVNSRATLARGQDMLKQMNESVTRVRKINEENEKYLAANREAMQQFQTTFVQSHELLSDLVQHFQTIDDGLQSIFAEIQRGLNTYATSTRKSINTYLRDFSNQLKSALEALSGTVEVIEDTVEDLRNTNKGNR